jgi:hypothetical protein
MTMEHFRELERAAAAIADQPSTADLPGALYALTRAFRALYEEAHAEALAEDAARTAHAEHQ